MDLEVLEHRELPIAAKRELVSRLAQGVEKRTVYTCELERAVVANSKSVFPVIGALQQSVQQVPLPGQVHAPIHWTEWINSRTLYSLEPTPADMDPASYQLSLDADATIVHTDTLKVLNQSINLNLTPQFSTWAMKIKHEYKGVTLHNVVNVQIGYLTS